MGKVFAREERSLFPVYQNNRRRKRRKRRNFAGRGRRKGERVKGSCQVVNVKVKIIVKQGRFI